MIKNKNINEILFYILAIIVIVGFFTSIIFLFIYKIPNENSQILNILIGCLVACFSTVVQYFFGSSIGSRQKTTLLQNNNKEINNKNDE